MSKNFVFIVFVSFVITACAQNSKSDNSIENKADTVVIMDVNNEKKPYEIYYPAGLIIKERFNPPDGFVRIKADTSSFAYYLRN